MNKNIFTGEGGNDRRVEEATQPARDRSRSRAGRGADAATGGEAAIGGTAITSRGRSTARRGGRGGAGVCETRRSKSDVSQHAAEIEKAVNAEGRDEDPLRSAMGLIGFRAYGGRAPGGEDCGDRSAGGGSGVDTGTGAGGSREASTSASRGASRVASPARSTASSRGRVRFAGGPSASGGENPDHRGLSRASSQASGLNEGDVPLEKRGRGRPETTGLHKVKQAEKARREEAAAEEAAGETVLRMNDPAIPPAERGNGAKRVDEAGIRADLAGKTVEEMAGILIQRMDSVDKGAQGSKNLKGTIAHEIKRATVEARVIARAMACAAGGSALPPAEREATGQMEENRLLKTEIVALKESVRVLREEMEQQRMELAGGVRVPGQKRRRHTPAASIRTGESESDASPDRMECGADPTWRPMPGEEAWFDASPVPPPLTLVETLPTTPFQQPGVGLTRAEVQAMMADMMASIKEELAVLRVTLRGPSGRLATTPPVTGRDLPTVPSSSSVPLAAPQEAPGAARRTRRRKKKKKKGGTGQGPPPAKV